MRRDVGFHRHNGVPEEPLVIQFLRNINLAHDIPDHALNRLGVGHHPVHIVG